MHGILIPKHNIGRNSLSITLWKSAVILKDSKVMQPLCSMESARTDQDKALVFAQYLRTV